MTRYLCSRCWQDQPYDDLTLECPNCLAGDAPAGPGDWLEPPIPRQLGRGANPDDDGHCPHHPDTLPRRKCPCGATLTDRHRHAEGELTALGIVGPPASGKTLLMITAMHAWQLAMDVPRPHGVGETDRAFGTLERALFHEGRRPDQTPRHTPERNAPPQNFLWRLALDHGSEPFLAWHDAGGGVWRERTGNILDIYMRLVSAVVFLMDGRAIAQDLNLAPRADAWSEREREPELQGAAADRQWFAYLLEALGDRKSRTSIAFVVSKAENIWDNAEWTSIKPPTSSAKAAAGMELREAKVRELMERSGRGALLDQGRLFAHAGYFAVSSLGFIPGGTDIVDLGEESRLRDPHRIQPAGVLDPFRWLLGQDRQR